MSGQTFRDNIEQEVHYLVYATDGDTDDLICELVDWVVGRFGPGAEGCPGTVTPDDPESRSTGL